MNFHVLVWSMLLAILAAAAFFYVIYSKPESSIGMPKQPPATSAPAPGSEPPVLKL
jgi:hypothetical protein